MPRKRPATLDQSVKDWIVEYFIAKNAQFFMVSQMDDIMDSMEWAPDGKGNVSGEVAIRINKIPVFSKAIVATHSDDDDDLPTGKDLDDNGRDDYCEYSKFETDVRHRLWEMILGIDFTRLFLDHFDEVMKAGDVESKLSKNYDRSRENSPYVAIDFVVNGHVDIVESGFFTSMIGTRVDV
jgi:hypothetical protein